MNYSKGDPVVSILIPVYNGEKYINKTIEALVNQTYKNIEIIICDDCSLDKTRDILKEWASKDSRIRVYYNKENLKISKNRNRLLSLARGEFIAWNDADDISELNRIELQMNYLKANPKVGIVGAWIKFVNVNDELIELRKYEEEDKLLRKQIFISSPVSQGVAMIRKSVLEQAGNFDTTLQQAEDLDLNLRIGMNSEFANLQQPLIKVLVHEDSISNSKIKQNIKDTLKVRLKAMKTYGYKPRFVDYMAFIATSIALLLPVSIIYPIFYNLRNIVNRLFK